MTYAIWIQSINVRGLGSFWSLLLVSGECVLLEEMAARDTFLILNQKTANQNNWGTVRDVLTFSANILANLQWVNEHSVRCNHPEQIRFSEVKQCEQGRGSDIFIIPQVYAWLWENMGRWISIWDVYLLRDANLDSEAWTQQSLWAGNWCFEFSKTCPSEHSLSRAGWVSQQQSRWAGYVMHSPLSVLLIIPAWLHCTSLETINEVNFWFQQKKVQQVHFSLIFFPHDVVSAPLWF